MKILLRFVLLLFLALPVFAGDDPLAARDPQGILSRDPYVQMPTQMSAVIVWRTNAPTLAVVSYGTAPDQLNSVVFPTQMTIKLGPDVAGAPDAVRLHSAPFGTYQYEALITGLTPDTKVYYSICDGTNILAGEDANHYFYTLPVVGTEKPMRLWVVGDSGNGSLAQISAFNAMRSVVATEGRPVDHYIHVGDMAYNTGLDVEFQAYFFEIYGTLLRNTPVWAAMGNHEGYTSRGATGVGPYYDAYAIPKAGECGGVASGTEAYYSYDIGKVHFVVLNSYDLPRAPTGAMAQWLQADLEQASAEWLIAFWHHPPYTKGSHDSDTEVDLIEMRTHILPILESAGVDMTLTGHSHIYERSMLIDGAYVTPTTTHGVVFDDGDGRPDGDGIYLKSGGLVANEGSVHIVAGNGRSAYNFAISPIMRETIAEVGSVLIDIDGDELKARMLNLTGDVRDWFTLKKSGAQPTPVKLLYPWNPFGPEYRTVQRDPGVQQVEILANPFAPDATVYFTTDGSVPGPLSAVYTGALTLAPGTIVKAMSVWRNDTRESPVSTYTVPQPQGGGIRLPLADGSNDAVEMSSGQVVLADPVLRLQSSGMAGLRFDDVRIPPGATVTAASVQFTNSALGTLSATFQIRSELAADSVPFGPGNFDLSMRPVSGTSVVWSVPFWFSTNQKGATQRTPDLSALLGEVMRAPGWQSGNAVTFFLQGSGDRKVVSFEGGGAKSAELILQYEESSAFDIAKRALPAVVVFGSPGQEVLQVSYKRFKNPGVLGLAYVLEMSADLSAGNWTAVTSPATFISPESGTAYEMLFYNGLPYDGTARFFRLKVTYSE